MENSISFSSASWLFMVCDQPIFATKGLENSFLTRGKRKLSAKATSYMKCFMQGRNTLRGIETAQFGDFRCVRRPSPAGRRAPAHGILNMTATTKPSDAGMDEATLARLDAAVQA